MHTEGPGIYDSPLSKPLNLYLERGKKVGKFRNVHCRTWNMARRLKIMENEKHPLDDLKNDEIIKKRENEKCTLKDLEYGEKTENHGK